MFFDAQIIISYLYSTLILKNLFIMEDILQKRVGFGPRFGAYVIDGVFITVICTVMVFIFGAAGAGRFGGILAQCCGQQCEQRKRY